MPAARELSDGEEPASRRELLDDASHAVAFLDAPDADTDDLMSAVLDAFSQLADDAVVTAYCTGIDLEELLERCESHGVAVVHSVSHGTGTTYILRRAGAGSGV